MTLTKEKAGKTHNLKIWPEHFAGVLDGIKRAELRLNDRAYQAGDILDLCEWDPSEEAFTGEYISVTVTHVAEIGQWMPGYVLLSIAKPAPVVTDGWVDCSERMPHIGVPVITCCGDVVQYAAYAWDGKEWQDWYEEYDKLPANTFTHWHSRPAAPQQEAE